MIHMSCQESIVHEQMHNFETQFQDIEDNYYRESRSQMVRS